MKIAAHHPSPTSLHQYSVPCQERPLLFEQVEWTAFSDYVSTTYIWLWRQIRASILRSMLIGSDLGVKSCCPEDLVASISCRLQSDKPAGYLPGSESSFLFFNAIIKYWDRKPKHVSNSSSAKAPCQAEKNRGYWSKAQGYIYQVAASPFILIYQAGGLFPPSLTIIQMGAYPGYC